MTVTLEKLQTQAKRPDRTNLGVAGVLKAMQNGNALHCELGESGTHWWLSNGRRVRPSVARVVVINPNIVGVGGSLFEQVQAQTYRYSGND